MVTNCTYSDRTGSNDRVSRALASSLRGLPWKVPLTMLLLAFIGCVGKDNNPRVSAPIGYRPWSITQYTVNGDTLDMIRIHLFRESDAMASVHWLTSTGGGDAMRVKVGEIKREEFDRLYEIIERASLRFTNNTVVLERNSYYGYQVKGEGLMNYFEFDVDTLDNLAVNYPDLMQDLLRGVEGWLEWEEDILGLMLKMLSETREWRSTSVEAWPKDISDFDTLR